MTLLSIYSTVVKEMGLALHQVDDHYTVCDHDFFSLKTEYTKCKKGMGYYTFFFFFFTFFCFFVFN